MAGGMPPFEAVLHAFTTMATGGFSPKNASIAAYPSPYIQWVIILFMGLAGTSFSLHYFALRRRSASSYWENTEFRFYLSMIVSAMAVGVRELARLNPLYTGLETLYEPLRTIGQTAYEIGGVQLHSGAVQAYQDAGLLN